MINKTIFLKISVTLLSTFLLISYLFMFFTYKNYVISSAILRSSSVAQTLGTISTPQTSMADHLTNLDIDTLNTFDINSSTHHLLLISMKDQTAYIFNGSLNNWILEKEFLYSTELPGTETPKGIFTCGFRGDWFFLEKFNKESKYYIHINDCYNIHSVPFYDNQATVAEDILCEPSSHGCVRLSVEDSKWIYENVKDGSTIIIY